MSCSYSLSRNVFSDRNILLAIYVPKNTHLYVTENDEESEVILPPGS